MQKEAYRCAQHARDGGVLPTTGFPRDDGMANEEHAKTSLGHGANTSISYNTCIWSMVDHLGVIPLKRAFRGGSSSSMEVVIHGSSWEVVVLATVVVHVFLDVRGRR